MNGPAVEPGLAAEAVNTIRFLSADAVEQAGGPWTPGRIPEWRR